MKKIINAVRAFCIKDETILCIKYINQKNNGYYDLPGGKIKENESIVDSSIREVKEETGIIIKDLSTIGKIEVEYEDIIFIYNLVVANSYEGNLISNTDNEALWININDLIKKDKKMSVIELLKSEYEEDIKNKDINMKLYCDNNHNVSKIERI